MAGVSSESLAKALAELEPTLPFATLGLAEELFGVLGTLDSSAGLGRALTDPARSPEAKATLVTELFRGRISADAEAIVVGLVSSRWARPRDLADALEEIGTTVVSAVAENKGPAQLEKLENELFAFSRLVESNHGLQAALVAPQAPAAARERLALELVPQATEEAKALIRQAVTAPRGLKPSALVEKFVHLVARRQQRWIATVSVSRPLSAEQIERLQAGLNRLYGRELKINVNVDPSLIGGVRVRVGDEVVDATVISQLAELRRRLAG